MKWTTVSAVAALLGAFSFAGASADPVAVSLPGDTQFDGWVTSELTAAANPGFPGHPGSGAWPSAISSGDDTATILKTAGSSYPGGGSLYSGGFTAVPNTFGASFSVSDASPIENVANVVFQIKLSAPYGFDFHNNALPVLNYNGGSQLLASDLNGITSKSQVAFAGSLADVTTYLFQWDLSSIGGITDFEIEFSNVQHGQIFALQLDQSSEYAVVDAPFLVPEPSTAILGGLGLVALCAVARRKRD